MGDLHEVLHHRKRVGAALVQFRKIGQRLGNPAAHHLFEQVEHAAAIRQPQHGAHAAGRDGVALIVGDGLVEQRQPVAHRAFGRARDQRQRRRLD